MVQKQLNDIKRLNAQLTLLAFLAAHVEKTFKDILHFMFYFKMTIQWL